MPWKWDRALYDRDGWMAGVGRDFERPDDGSVLVRVWATNEQGYCNDVYHEETETFVLRSTDGGLTWSRYDGPALEEGQTRLSDGTLVKVYDGGAVSLEDKRRLLESVGAKSDSVAHEGADLWPDRWWRRR